MNHKRTLLVVGLAACLMMLSIGVPVLWGAAPATAQSSQSYRLEWHTIAGGGGPASSDSYKVDGTMGQMESGASPPTSDSYRVSGGFWGGGGFAQWRLVYLPVVVRDYP